MSLFLKGFFKFLVAAVIAVFAVSSLTACSAEKIDMGSVAAVIDVRTPEETAAGYLEGALLFDIQGAAFNTQLDTLDKAANYVVYCRSGNRAGQAIEFMKSAGFTGTLTNAGGLSAAASATGLKVIQ
jgi:rhodanese-related sulfurtransferase